MAAVIVIYSKLEVGAVVRGSVIHCRSVSVYSQRVFSRKEVFVWCNNIKMAERH
jgi:hypothetical protein